MNTPLGNNCRIEHLAYLLRISIGEKVGLLIPKKNADRHLSDYTLNKGAEYENYLYYTEKDIPLVLFELPGLWMTISPKEAFEDPTNLPIRDYYIRKLSEYHSDYLIEKNINPVNL